jgi:carbonyl reductase 1/carbonyl reductase 3
MSEKIRRVIVTGSNKGIGFQIVKQLYELPHPYHIIMTGRDEEKSQASKSQILSKPSQSSKIDFHKLDVTDSKSISQFVTWVKEHFGEIDVLVNNAGYGWLKNFPEEGLLALKTNFYGPVELIESLLPILSKDGKIINVTSESGCLYVQRFSVRQALEKPMSKEQLMELSKDYEKRIHDKNYTATGWFEQHYYNTKCLLNAYTRWVLPKLLKDDQSCYALDPGFCKTDMAPEGIFPVEVGAQTPLHLIQLPFKADPEYHGKFFMECKVCDW